MYKPSIFNNYFVNQNNELVIYNSYVGYDSLLKFNSGLTNSIYPLLQKSYIEDSEIINNSNLKNILIRNNYIVDSEVIEHEYVYNLFYSQMNSSMLRLTILPTGQCNYRCKYCYEDFELGDMSEETQDGIVKFVKKYLFYFSGLAVSWFGGEPLLKISVIEKLNGIFNKICSLAKKPFTSSITTNGYLLDDKNLERLIKVKVLKYQISLDGLKDHNDFYKPLVSGKGTFDKIINNIKLIKSNVKSSLFHIAIRTNFTKDTLDEIEQYYNFLEELLDNDARFSLFVRPVGNIGGDAVKQISEKLINIEYDLYEKSSSLNKNIKFTQHIDALNVGGCMCYASKNNDYIILPNGNLSKCTCNLKLPLNIIGKIALNGDMEINKINYSKWVTELRLTDKCKQCSILPLCFNKACPVMLINNDDENFTRCPCEKESILSLLSILSRETTPINEV